MTNTQKTLAEFITDAIRVHGSQYDYSRFSYLNAHEKSVIICPRHGEFFQTPNDHLSGKGCQKCGFKKAGINQRVASTKKAISFVTEKYNSKYDYSRIPLDTGVSNKTTIVCPLHGNFLMSLNTHRKHGCGKCGRASSPGWYNKKRLSSPDLSTKTGRFYIIKLTSHDEEFLKIGITKLSYEKRFSELHRNGYTSTLLHDETDLLSRIKPHEDAIKRILKPHRYIPLRKFGGMTECYHLKALDVWRDTLRIS